LLAAFRTGDGVPYPTTATTCTRARRPSRNRCSRTCSRRNGCRARRRSRHCCWRTRRRAPASHLAGSGVEDRVTFHDRDAADAGLAGRYDLVTIFEALHDMSYPVDVLRAARNLLADGGVGFIGDERTEDEFTAPASEVERLYYGFSVFHWRSAIGGQLDVRLLPTSVSELDYSSSNPRTIHSPPVKATAVATVAQSTRAWLASVDSPNVSATRTAHSPPAGSID
jgi:hypothetical protein